MNTGTNRANGERPGLRRRQLRETKLAALTRQVELEKIVTKTCSIHIRVGAKNGIIEVIEHFASKYGVNLANLTTDKSGLQVKIKVELTGDEKKVESVTNEIEANVYNNDGTVTIT